MAESIENKGKVRNYMNTFQLECFLEVVETLNFARAADNLHVTQPAVTQQIHSLEKELNVKLFRRTTRSVRITEEGRLFFDDARNIVEISKRAVKKFEEPRGGKVQFLTLGSYSNAQLFLFIPALEAMRAQYPELRPRLRVVPFQHLYRLLEDDEVDAVAGFREPPSRKIAAVFEELFRVPLSLICRVDNPLAARKSISLDEIKQEKMILLYPARAQSDAAKLQGEIITERAASEFCFCESSETAVVLIRAGYGSAILPDLLIPPEFSLARVPIKGTEPVSFGIYYKSVEGNAPLKSLIRYMKNEKYARDQLLRR